MAEDRGKGQQAKGGAKVWGTEGGFVRRHRQTSLEGGRGDLED